MDITNALIGVFCAIILAVALLAGAAYTQQADYQNQTDSFGYSHTQLENSSALAMNNLSAAAPSIGGGLVIFAAIILIIVLIVAFVALTHKPRW